MRDNTLRTVGAAVVLVAIAVAAISQMGSGGDPSAISFGNDDSANEPATTNSPSTTSAPEPFVYRVGVLAGVSTDNFWAFYGGEASVWNAYILGPTKPALYTIDPESGTLQPEFATVEVSPTSDGDGWQVVVDLDETIRWSDGAPITARDIVFTFETVRDLDLTGSWSQAFPTTIESMHAEDPHRLQIEYSQRPSLSQWPHGPGLAPIMPAHVWEPLVPGITQDDLYQLPGTIDVGGGPLAIADISETMVTSVANPGFPDGHYPDVVEYHIYGDEAEAVWAVGNGDIDVVLTPNGLAESHLGDITADPAIVVETSPANGVRYLGFNLNREPMSDQAFRTALALLLDRAELAEAIPAGASVPYSFVSDANTLWFDADAAQSNADRHNGPLADRLASALTGLRQVGYTWEAEPIAGAEGVVVAGTGLQIHGLAPTPLTILTPGDAYDPARPLYAAEIAEALGWLGFDVRPVETDFDTVVDLAFTAGDDGLMHYDMYLLGWTLGNPSLPSYYRPLFAADGVMNNTGYDSAVFAEQLAVYEGSFSIEQARDALWSMEATLAADLPYLLLYAPHITEIYRSDRVAFGLHGNLGGLQGRLGGIGDVRPTG